MLCVCLGYTREEIVNMVAEGSYETLADFQEDTFIGTGCGRCLPDVDEILTKKSAS